MATTERTQAMMVPIVDKDGLDEPETALSEFPLGDAVLQVS